MVVRRHFCRQKFLAPCGLANPAQDSIGGPCPSIGVSESWRSVDARMTHNVPSSVSARRSGPLCVVAFCRWNHGEPAPVPSARCAAELLSTPSARSKMGTTISRDAFNVLWDLQVSDAFTGRFALHDGFRVSLRAVPYVLATCRHVAVRAHGHAGARLHHHGDG